MRIVLHGGLHKSGTTSIQHSWRKAYSGDGDPWYPSAKGVRHPGHHTLFWPLMDAFTEQIANDLVWAATRTSGQGSLAGVLRTAQERNVDTLVLSTEELDRIERDDVERLAEVLAGHDVTAVLTVTRPMHRWCSGWQELVKHGMSQYPRDGADDVMAFASLGKGRVQEIIELIPASRRIIRLVRTSPPEEELPQDLAKTAGLVWPAGLEPPKARNVSMGVDIEVLRRINVADLTLGTVVGDGRELVASFKGTEPTYAERSELDDAYEPPPALWAAVEAEFEYLSNPGALVEVVDPHGELAHWRSHDAPEWYAEVRTRELVAPELDVPIDMDTMLWRVRQERSAFHDRLEVARAAAKDAAEETEARHRKELKSLRAQLTKQARPPMTTPLSKKLRRRVGKTLRRVGLRRG